MNDDVLTPKVAAPQHAPRPLPLFLSLLRSETAASPARRAAALAGLAAYETAERERPRAPRPEWGRSGRACLRDYGGTGRPVVFVPSLINPPFVLDLAPGNSLMEWIAARGHRALLVDWGTPTPDDRAQDIGDHVADLLLPMLRALPEPPVLVGYCLGGTMAIAAAQLLPAAGLALLATPWRFGGFDAAGRAETVALWQASAATCEAMGLVPVEVLQSGFWQLDPARTIAKFEAFGRVAPASDTARAFVALEDWANGGAPLTLAAGRQLFEDFFGGDLTGRGAWVVQGQTIEPAALPCPVLDLVSTRDRIVPAGSSAGFADERAVDAGHVGMIVGSRARTSVWEPLADWLSALDAAR